MIVMQRRFSDVRIAETEVCFTLESGAGDGGNNLPMILEIHETEDTDREEIL